MLFLLFLCKGNVMERMIKVFASHKMAKMLQKKVFCNKYAILCFVLLR